MCFSLMFSLQVINGHYVEFPAAQLRSQADVLTITSDRLRQITGFNGDIHGMFIFVHHDRRDVCRRHRINDELRRVIIPQHDIDTLTAQFGRDRLNARAAHPHASADRIDTFIVGFHCDFRTRTRIASRRFNFNHFFADFRHFDAEQFDQHFRLGTGDEQLRATRFRANSVQHAANTVARAEVFARQHIFTQNHRFSVTGHPFGFNFQRDIVAVHFLHHASDDFAFLVAELIDNHRAFSFTDLLYDNLFRSLRGDTVKGDRFNLIFNIVADIQAFVFKTRRFQRNFLRRHGHFFNDQPTTESIKITAFTIDFYTNIDLLLIFFLCCCRQRTFQRFKNFFAWQRFFVGDGFNNSQNFFVHRGLFTSSRLLKVGNQVRLLDITQREHFIFAFDCDGNHFTVHRFDNALPLATVLYRHAKNQRDFFTLETRIMIGSEHRTVETR